MDAEISRRNPTESPLVSVIILNWNGFDDTVQCLRSLTRVNHKPFEVILVDNGSSDGSPERLPALLANLPYQTELILNDANLGFAGGNAVALERCQGELIALLNNDTVVDPDWLGALVQRMAISESIAVVGGKAYVWDGDHPAHDKSSPFYSYQEIDPYLAYAHTRQNVESARYVDSISGCAVMLRRSTIEELGFLDKRFFAYYEETDLFARFIRSGRLVAYEPAAMVWHKVAKSAGPGSAFYSFYMQRNRAYFALRNFDRPYLRRFLRTYLKHEGFHLYKYWCLRLKRAPSNEPLQTRARAFLSLLRATPRLLAERRKIVRRGRYNSRLSLLRDLSVSVIIPNYNYARYVGEAIESVLNQAHPPDEIVVVDDGSTDDSVSVIERYGVTLVRQRNQGVVAAKNRGFQESHGRYVLFLDADDRLRPEAIRKYLRAITADPAASFVYSDAEYFGAKQGVLRGRRFKPRALMKGNYIHNSSLLKREVFEYVGGYDPSMTEALEDWDLYLTLAERGHRGIYVPEVLLDYRQHDARSRNSPNYDEDRALALQASVRQRHPGLDPLGVRRRVAYLRSWVSWRVFRGTIPLRPRNWSKIPGLIRLRMEERRNRPPPW